MAADIVLGFLAAQSIVNLRLSSVARNIVLGKTNCDMLLDMCCQFNNLSVIARVVISLVLKSFVQ